MELEKNNPDLAGSIIELREPTTGKTGQEIRSLLASKINTKRSVWIDLFMRDREENVQNNILPSLIQKKIILQDRYFYSTAAYQGDDENPPTSSDIIDESLEKNFPEPDLLFFLDLPPEMALDRLIKTREKMESFETLNQLENFYKNFLFILPENCIFLDAMEDQNEIVHETVQIIENYIKENSQK